MHYHVTARLSTHSKCFNTINPINCSFAWNLKPKTKNESLECDKMDQSQQRPNKQFGSLVCWCWLIDWKRTAVYIFGAVKHADKNNCNKAAEKKLQGLLMVYATESCLFLYIRWPNQIKAIFPYSPHNNTFLVAFLLYKRKRH